MAAKKTTKRRVRGRGKGKYGAASNFVRGANPTLAAKEVVELAKKQGIKVSLQLVYNIRMKMRGGAGGAGGSTKRKPGALRATRVAARHPETRAGWEIRALVDNFVADVQAIMVARLTKAFTLAAPPSAGFR